MGIFRDWNNFIHYFNISSNWILEEDTLYVRKFNRSIHFSKYIFVSVQRKWNIVSKEIFFLRHKKWYLFVHYHLSILINGVCVKLYNKFFTWKKNRTLFINNAEIIVFHSILCRGIKRDINSPNDYKQLKSQLINLI